MTRSMTSYINYTSASTSPNTDQMNAMTKPISLALRAVAPLATGITSQVPAVNAVTQEIYAFSDALQATRPIYVQVTYNNNLASPTMSFSVATSVAGGTLGGNTLALSAFMSNTSGQTNGTTKYFYAATGDGSFLSMLCNVSGNPSYTANDSIGGVVIERTRDADGTPNGNGYTVWRWNQTADQLTGGASTYAGVQSRIYDLTGNVAQPTTTSFDYNASVPHQALMGSATSGGSSLVGDTTYVYPVFTNAGTLVQGASKALALGWAADLPRVAPVTLTQYGTPGTWLSMGNAAAAYVPFLTVSSVNATVGFKQSGFALTPIFRWE